MRKFAVIFKNATDFQMIRIEDFLQLKAFARQDAMILAAMWTVSFLCVTMAGAGALGNLLAIATPFLVGWRLIKFRDNVLGGSISFRRAFAFSLHMFIYASLVFALVQFVYFRFIDHGSFAGMIGASMRLLAPMYKESGISQQQITQSISLVNMLTPVQWAFMFMMQNMLIGVIASLPIAAVCKRSNQGTLGAHGTQAQQ